MLLLGLDSAGKTSVLMWMLAGKKTNTIPTVGFNVKSFQVGKLKLNVWDVGGQSKVRAFWRHYYTGTEGIVFVVDASDLGRIKEAAEELEVILSDSQLSDACVLIFANKQDLPGALKRNDLASRLQLTTKFPKRSWYIQPSTAVSGEGLEDGFLWLARHMKRV